MLTRLDFSLQRHEQCLEQRQQAGSIGAGAVGLVGATDRASHWGPARDGRRLLEVCQNSGTATRGTDH
jgi:hypothetical protein